MIIDEGNKKKTFHLNRSYIGLYVPPLVWRTLDNFSTNSLALILASRKYEEKDYIRDYNHFKKFDQIKLSPSIDSCSIIEIPKISNRAGNISPVQNETILPFDIKECFTFMIYQEAKKGEVMRIKNPISF